MNSGFRTVHMTSWVQAPVLTVVAVHTCTDYRTLLRLKCKTKKSSHRAGMRSKSAQTGESNTQLDAYVGGLLLARPRSFLFSGKHCCLQAIRAVLMPVLSRNWPNPPSKIFLPLLRVQKSKQLCFRVTGIMVRH